MVGQLRPKLTTANVSVGGITLACECLILLNTDGTFCRHKFCLVRMIGAREIMNLLTDLSIAVGQWKILFWLSIPTDMFFSVDVS